MMMEREAAHYDVVIVGAGPAGLSAAIRLKQLGGDDLSVCCVEKGGAVGSHILSGAILDPSGLAKLFPDGRFLGPSGPLATPVQAERFFILGKRSALSVPGVFLPPQLSNRGCYLVSMGVVCRWLADQAEALGVDIFPGMSASSLLWGSLGEVCGVVAGEFGLTADGVPGRRYEPGMELRGKYTFLAEGARGSLTRGVLERYALDKQSDVSLYGLGMKELWEVAPLQHKEGAVFHSLGWPLGWRVGGGGFLYHLSGGRVAVGFVVHLNYANPHLFPYMEFQRFKHHPRVASILRGGRRISYGARVIAEGGWQSLPRLSFPGGVLLGCAAGMVDFARLKGNHNAMLSGCAAAEAAFSALSAGRLGDELSDYDLSVRSGVIGRDLRRSCNLKPLWSRGGLAGGLALGGMDLWWASLFGRPLFGVLRHGQDDAGSTEPAARHRVLSYPKADGVLSFDRMTNMAFSGTGHDAHEPCHLHLADPAVPIGDNLVRYKEPAQRYCPAGVYEVLEGSDGGNPRFQINAANCLHCKTCDIKDPARNITWRVPQGGGGPRYQDM